MLIFLSLCLSLQFSLLIFLSLCLSLQFSMGITLLETLNITSDDFDPFNVSIQQAIYWLNAGKCAIMYSSLFVFLTLVLFLSLGSLLLLFLPFFPSEFFLSFCAFLSFFLSFFPSLFLSLCLSFLIFPLFFRLSNDNDNGHFYIVPNLTEQGDHIAVYSINQKMHT